MHHKADHIKRAAKSQILPGIIGVTLFLLVGNFCTTRLLIPFVCRSHLHHQTDSCGVFLHYAKYIILLFLFSLRPFLIPKINGSIVVPAVR